MKKRAIGEAGWGGTAIAAIVGFIYFFPVLFIILTAFRSRSDTLATPPKWIFTPKGTSTTQREAKLTLGNNSEHGRCIQLTSPVGFVKAAKLTSDICDYTSIY